MLRNAIEVQQAPLGFNQLIKSCLKYDLVEIMIMITSRYGIFRLGMKNGHALASYCGLAVLVNILHIGTHAEKKMVADEMVKHDIVDLCLKVRPNLTFQRGLTSERYHTIEYR